MKKINLKSPLAGVLFTAFGAMCWGFSGTCGQYLFQNYSISSEWLSTMRMLIAGTILIILGFITNRKNMIAIWKTPKSAIRLLLFSVFGLMFSQYTYMTAISHSNAGTATILQYLNPVMIMLYVCLRGKRPPKTVEIISIILALGGTFILATHCDLSSLAITTEGLIWGLLAALGAALYTLLGGKIVAEFGSNTVTGYGMLIGGIFLGTVRNSFITDAKLELWGFLALAAIVIIGTVCAFSMFLKGVSLIGPVKASLIGSLEPVSAAVFAVVWLKTEFVFLDIVGFAMILATVFLLSAKKQS